MKHGKSNELNCTNCGKINIIHPNKFFARESKTAHLIAGLAFLIGSSLACYAIFVMMTETNSTIGIYIVAGLLLIPMMIYLIIDKEERKRVRTFNHTYVKE